MYSLSVGLDPETADAYPPLVFAIDEEFCLPLVVAWQSLCDSNEGIASKLSIQVLNEGLPEGCADYLLWHADRLGLNVQLKPVTLADIRYPVAFGGVHANYLRLMIPELLEGLGTVLYLDADILITGDLRPLLKTELHGAPIAAVRDPVNPAYRYGRALPGWSRLGLPAEREYFNSGVLLIDTSICVAEGTFQRALTFIAEHPEHIRLWDQDALNWAVADRWERLAAQWNAFPMSSLLSTRWINYTAEELVPLSQLLAVENDAAIIHYATPAKPWKGLLPAGGADSLYQHYLRAVRATDFPEPVGA
ncbi:glycosyltransferase family 8 protein [Streptomyces pathocidini]|uniref:glycosyltransferase family 8 protein n=1 Tax=Streptomyces pathocidini TaxID=1650571 RepID=UPI0033EA7919